MSSGTRYIYNTTPSFYTNRSNKEDHPKLVFAWAKIITNLNSVDAGGAIIVRVRMGSNFMRLVWFFGSIIFASKYSYPKYPG